MLVWIIEALFAVIVSSIIRKLCKLLKLHFIILKVNLCGIFIEDNDLDGIVKIGYVTVTCGLTSALYLLGIYKND